MCPDADVVEQLEGAATVATWMSAADAAALREERANEIKPIIEELLATP